MWFGTIQIWVAAYGQQTEDSNAFVLEKWCFPGHVNSENTVVMTPDFTAYRWAAFHCCRPVSQEKRDFKATWCLTQFLLCLGALQTARPGQRFLAIWAEQFVYKATKAAFTSHWSIPFLKHNALGVVQAHICSLLHAYSNRMDYFQFLLHFSFSSVSVFPSEGFVGIYNYRKRSQ